MSGCSVFGTTLFVSTGCPSDTAFKIGPYECKDNEVKVYLTSYADYYGMIGDKYIWDGDIDTTDVEDSLKSSVKQLITRVYAMNLYAKDNGISLSDTQNSEVLQAANEYYSLLNNSQKADFNNISKEDITEMYSRYALALLVYNQLMGEIDEDISEDESRVVDAYVLQVPKDEDLSSISSSLENPERFPMVVQAYSVGECNMLHLARNTFPAAVEEAAFKLENGEITGPVSCDNFVYYVSCVNKYNEDLSADNKVRIITSKQQKLLSDIEKSQNEKYYSVVNDKYWDSLNVKGDGQDRSKLFFSILEKHLII